MHLTAPTVHGNLLSVGTSNIDSTGSVLGFHEDGRIAYRHELPREVKWKPASRDGEIYVAGLDGGLTVVATDDGRTLWQSAGADALVGSPRVVEGRLFTIDVRGRLKSVDADSGSLEWGRDLDEVVSLPTASPNTNN
ncbi:PQQ-binding-like beta-propeller repeat protein (plasmid) [Halorussus salilacus]|uniref:outer membrane protein assembly factor BamB family protein n=1 Tax=Halorussus salilacus TaxID=2953750 RepID=UPI00209F21CE|nr:PQQ-binding-like beta-propeller repeat protein [Halorussus salilacus]USZ70161.1 PQQ-binding-like beta-propeller repeat protein [Halorussus salilacus]